MVTGSEALAKRLTAIPQAVLEALRPALTESAHEIASDAKAQAETSRRSGALIASIDATGPGETTLAYSSEGGSRTAEEGLAFVTAGDPDARHGHLVEFGTGERFHKDGSPTGKMPAKPFLLPAWRLNKNRIRNRLRRVIRAEVKKAAEQ